jgi:phospholipase/lecithinase/hemolysin
MRCTEQCALQYQGNTALASSINTFNTLLSSAVSGFAANHTGVKTWLYDSHAAFETILNSPKTYGFVDATSYGAPGDFWGCVTSRKRDNGRSTNSCRNSLHPSSAASTLLGKQISTLLDGTVF